jgi:hypothetical protein
LPSCRGTLPAIEQDDVTAVGEPTVTTDIEFVVVNEDGAQVRGARGAKRLCRFGQPQGVS